LYYIAVCVCLVVDFDRTIGKGDRNALSLATYFRLHRLLAPMLDMKVNSEGSLLEAVVNRDEIAVATLLQYSDVIKLLANTSLNDHSYQFSRDINDSVIIDLYQKAAVYWNFSMTDIARLNDIIQQNSSDVSILWT
jgi:hypothetical protein